MATKQTINLGNRYSEDFKEPILEIGSKINSNYKQFSPRIIHEDNISYIGIDIEKGNGVDKIVDLSLNNNIIEELGWQEKFNTIHCHCVLEHVLDIFKFSNNISKILKKGGILYITIPFSWRIHRIPVDMWRFTPQSIDYLFPKILFEKKDCFYSTRHMDDLIPVDSGPKEFQLGSKLRQNGIFMYLLVKLLRKLNLDNKIFHERALLLENNLMMIGKKCDSSKYTFLSEEYLQK